MVISTDPGSSMVAMRPAAVLGLAAWLTACSVASPERQFVDDAVEALGGRDRLSEVTSLVIVGEGTSFNLGQDMTWESAEQTFALTDVRRILDLEASRLRIEQTRTPTFLYFQGPEPQRQILGLEGDVAYTISPSGTANRQSASIASDRRIELYHHPITMVRALADSPDAVANVRTSASGREADIRIGETTFLVRLDSRGLPASISSAASHPNMGDVTIETAFADYRETDGLTVPMRITTTTDRHPTTEIRVTAYSLGSNRDEAVAPAAATSLPAPTPPAPNVVATPISTGVWRLDGQSHHSALIEFADHLVLVEAPQSEARTLAVIAKARELVPTKPLRDVVISHHHFDHSAGLRAAAAEGMGIITHSANLAFVNEMLKRPHTRQPDALQRNPKSPQVRVVGDELTLADSTMTVTLYPLNGNPHGDTMLMAYLPASRVVIQADAYSPGGTYHPYAANLLESLRARQLAVDRIVPLHGAVAPFADLVAAVGAK